MVKMALCTFNVASSRIFKEEVIAMVVILKSVRFTVRKCLAADERCRNDDLLLVTQVQLSRPDADPSTIRRYRAQFQNNRGWYLPTRPAVLKRRNRHKPNRRKHL
jgi:hypothetical protein